ncbi:OmpA family protein [Ideonella sp. DXS29W]|uniref:OmpA family protein n=1 Tax=Ideonella lacteola TaxID=2984193 RepID=A0ABU9BTB2_9BURK
MTSIATQGRAAALVFFVAGLAGWGAWAQTPAPAARAADKVVVSGVVPDEATRSAIVARMRELYGADRVVDQLGVDRLVAPPNWNQHIQRLLTPDLKRVTKGQLSITGNVVELSGEVDNEATRQQLLSQMATQLNNPTYTVRDQLRIGSSGQAQLDAALARRTIEFETGNAKLTSAGARVLDDLVPILNQFAGRRFEIIGHTDDVGAHDANMALSAARADAVKAYLVGKGIPAADLLTSGAGPDRPVTTNTTAEGRARNRRIEFRVLA